MILKRRIFDNKLPDYLKHWKWKLCWWFYDFAFPFQHFLLTVILLSSHQNNERAGAGLISVFRSDWLIELPTIFALTSLTSLCGHAALVVKFWVKNLRFNDTELSGIPKWWVRLPNSRQLTWDTSLSVPLTSWLGNTDLSTPMMANLGSSIDQRFFLGDIENATFLTY